MADDVPFVIINPNSNGGKTGKELDYILDTCKRVFGEFNFKVTRKLGDGVFLAKEAKEAGFKTIVAIGGDGTLNEVSNVVANTDIKVGLVARGGSCDAHQTHGIPRKLEESLEIVANGYNERFPLGLARGDTDRYFVDMTDAAFTGAAADADATFGWEWLPADFRYGLIATKIALFNYRPIPSKIVVDDQIREVKVSAFAVGLSNVLAGFQILPGNHPRRNEFGVLIAKDLKGFRLIYNMLRALKGKHLKNKKHIEVLWGRNVVIESEKPMTWEAEGEIYSRKSTRVEIEYLPNAINLIIPEGWQYETVAEEKPKLVSRIKARIT